MKIDNLYQAKTLNPRPVDVAVSRPIGESYTDQNVQTDVAVKELIKQLDDAKKSMAGK